MAQQPALQEVLAGPQSAIYGPLPKVALPGDDETLRRFALLLLPHLKGNGIYRRDNVPLFPYEEKARLEIMNSQGFRTFVDKFVACYKQKFDSHDEPFDVLRSMNKETAEGVLNCFDFWKELDEIIEINPVPLPAMADDGTLSLLLPGYDDKTKTLTFK